MKLTQRGWFVCHTKELHLSCIYIYFTVWWSFEVSDDIHHHKRSLLHLVTNFRRLRLKGEALFWFLCACVYSRITLWRVSKINQSNAKITSILSLNNVQRICSGCVSLIKWSYFTYFLADSLEVDNVIVFLQRLRCIPSLIWKKLSRAVK